MSDAGRHPNIELLTLSEVKEVSGYVGNFHVRVLKRSRYVRASECTSCGECVDVCPVVVPDEFNMGLSSRRAIYSPFPQAIPSAYVVDIESCLGHNPIICGKCREKCEKNCIDFNLSDEILEFDVGTIIVATGMEVYDPTELDEYSYTRFSNVLTSMELERLINAGGPTEGHVLRLSDQRVPDSVAFIQCVGSRSFKTGHRYCSNICCMNTIKSTIMLKEHYPGMEVKVFYIDIRAFGKGFEDLFQRSKQLGVRFIRGLPGSVKEDAATGDLILTVENTATNQLEKHRAGMVILATGVHAPEDMHVLQEMMALQKTADGLKESVTQASAAAARAMRLMTPGELTVDSITAEINPEACTACGICARVCPYNAIQFDKRSGQPARVTTAACAGCGTCSAECPSNAIEMHHFTDAQLTAQIDAILSEDTMNRIVVFACNWCSYAGADFAGVSRLQYPPNARLIRTMCSGRVKEDFVWHAFAKGAPVVLISGCHIGDCHYIDANHWTEKRLQRMWKKMETLGLRKERLQLEWVSAAEAVRWRDVMENMEKLRTTVTAKEVAETKKALAQQRKKPARGAAKQKDTAAPAQSD